MKNLRQSKILELITEYRLDTQEELQEKLKECGFNVTQATVSRDIRELGIIKSEGDDGVYKYRTVKTREQSDEGGKFSAILRQTVANVAFANNLIVVKTHSGMGSAAGAAVDSMQLPNVIGTLAGDDTLLIIAADNENAKIITKTLNEMIGK
ncbi:MAG: arginine repressor [Clostridia bacterium]|nr:arginine repressor [Clostridia bacterium]MBR6755047.1 arginine repressor [Clostridia bacterium]